jgi:hypothetical protein
MVGQQIWSPGRMAGPSVRRESEKLDQCKKENAPAALGWRRVSRVTVELLVCRAVSSALAELRQEARIALVSGR